MTEIICAVIAAASGIMVAVIERRNKKQVERTEKRAERRAMESRLAMDLMYANCALALTTAKKLANMHTNGDVEDAMKAADEAQRAYIGFVRDEAAKQLSKQ